MANIEVPPSIHEETHERISRHAIGRDVAIGGSALEGILGLGAVVLAVLGLAGFLPNPLAAIAVIATGAALLFEGASVGAHAKGQPQTERKLMMGGVGAESIAGIGAIALGVISLVGVDPMKLLPISAIVLGAGVLLSSGATVTRATPFQQRLGSFGTLGTTTERESEVTESTFTAVGMRTLVGAVSLLLGIIGVLGVAPVNLTLISMLSIGASLLLSGVSVGARMASTMVHREA